jgi:hypothetical protein
MDQYGLRGEKRCEGELRLKAWLCLSLSEKHFQAFLRFDQRFYTSRKRRFYPDHLPDMPCGPLPAASALPNLV